MMEEEEKYSNQAVQDEDVTSRIIQIIDGRCGGSQTKFSQMVNVNQTTLNNYCARRRAVSLEVVLSVLERFPDISAEWLLRGRGEMAGHETDTCSGNTSPLKELLALKDNECKELRKENERLNDWVDILLKKGV